MINLLPVSEKKKVKKEYQLRFFAVTLFFVSGLIAIGVVLLIPSFVFYSFEYKNNSKQLTTEKRNLSETIGVVDPIEVAKIVNENLDILGGKEYAIPRPNDVFTVITKNKPVNIQIFSMLYDRDSLSGKIVISGISKNRETLLSFLRLLEKEDIFTEVDLPISSFVEESNIDFSVNITINKEI